MQAQGDFSLNAGQHSVTYLPSSDTAATGRYQVLLYDNNFGATERYPKFDWGQLGAAVVTDYSKGTHSFGRIFTVDETARTYELVDQIAVPFSGYVSSVQRVGDSNSMLVASGMAKTFAEYDRYGLPIPPTRWKPKSTSTACTSTSCSAALGCACAPWLRALAPGPPRVPHHFTSNSTRSSSGTLRSMSLRATWRSCVPSASPVVTWATISRSTMPSSSPSVAEVSTATV